MMSRVQVPFVGRPLDDCIPNHNQYQRIWITNKASIVKYIFNQSLIYHHHHHHRYHRHRRCRRRLLQPAKQQLHYTNQRTILHHLKRLMLYATFDSKLRAPNQGRLYFTDAGAEDCKNIAIERTYRAAMIKIEPLDCEAVMDGHNNQTVTCLMYGEGEGAANFTVRTRGRKKRLFDTTSNWVTYDKTAGRYGYSKQLNVCVKVNRAFLALPMDQLDVGETRVKCHARLPGATVKSAEIIVPRKLLPCRPNLSVNFELEPIALYLGKNVDATCTALVGNKTNESLTWALVPESGPGWTWGHQASSRHTKQDVIIGEPEERQTPYGIVITSSLTVERPKNYGNARVACFCCETEAKRSTARELLERSVRLVRSDLLGHTSQPIRLMHYPVRAPELTVLYHDSPAIVYVGRRLEAICSAYVGSETTETPSPGRIMWIFEANGNHQNWTVMLDEQIRGQAEGFDIDVIKLFFSPTLGPHMTSRFSVQVDHTIDQGTVTCMTGGRHGKTGLLQVSLPLQINYIPQKPELTHSYVSWSGTPAVRVKCRAYVGTAGSLVWVIEHYNSSSTIRWSFDLMGQRKEQVPEGFSIDKPHVSFDEQHGPHINSAATIKVNINVNNAVVVCLAANSLGVENASQLDDSMLITLRGAVKHFQDGGPIRMDDLKTVGVILFILLGLFIASVAISELITCLEMRNSDPVYYQTRKPAASLSQLNAKRWDSLSTSDEAAPSEVEIAKHSPNESSAPRSGESSVDVSHYPLAHGNKGSNFPLSLGKSNVFRSSQHSNMLHKSD